MKGTDSYYMLIILYKHCPRSTSLFIDGFEAFLNKFKKNVWGGQVLLNFYESFLCNVKDKDIMTVLWIVSGPMNKTMFDSAL